MVPHFRLLEHWPDIDASDMTSVFRLKIGKPDVIGPKLRDHDPMCARVSGHWFQDVWAKTLALRQAKISVCAFGWPISAIGR